MPNTRGGIFGNIFTQRSTLQGRCRGENFFFSISQHIKVNGVTLDEYILPYHFIIIIPN